MNLDFKKIFRLGQKNPPARVRITRNMNIAPLDESPRHVAAGEEIVVSFDVLRQLDQADFVMLDAGRPVVEVGDPVPPRQEHRPLPPRWSELPACFSDYWNLTEDFRTAREHITAIREARVQIFGSDIEISRVQFVPGDDSGGIILMGGAMHADPRYGDKAGLISTLKQIDTSDPKLRKLDRLLSIGEDAAREFYERLVESKSIAMQRAFLACGQHRLAVADELRAVLEELAGIGFDLFSVRTAALGLADFQVRRLFHGSADHQRFAAFPPAVTMGTSSAGLDANGQPIVYSDQPAATQAEWAIGMADRLAELRPLLEQGKRELTKARKVSQAV